MADVQEWLLRWFEKKGPLPGKTPESKLKLNYFEAGLIDSLAVVQLVADIEAAFPIRFTDKHYQESRFSTIGGLAGIISELAASKTSR